MRFFITAIIVTIFTINVVKADAKNSQLPQPQTYQDWQQGFIARAKADGIDAKVIEQAFSYASKPNDRIITLDNRQPEKIKTLLADYLQRIVSENRVSQGRKKMRANIGLLTEIGKKYGVQPRFIVALWGVETNYGQVMGSYHVIEALSTLAFNERRRSFFEKQLMSALRILNNGDIAVDRFYGSWAGAMGQSQFMPTSYEAYAVDYDKDGKKDIWTNNADIFASIANYLAKHGWDNERTWGRKTLITQPLPDHINAQTKLTLTQWHELGIKKFNGKRLPFVNIQATLYRENNNSKYGYLTYENFAVLRKWNRSNFFATSVGLLSDALIE